MKKTINALLCAVLFFGTSSSVCAESNELVKFYKACVSHTAISLLAYPFIRDVYEGVHVNRACIPLHQYLQDRTVPECFDYVCKTSMPYAQHAALLLLGAYAIKTAVDGFLNE